METHRIYNENCLDTMARMPDGFLQCVITSPPYYGLRSYKTEPQIWDGDRGCNHVWGIELKNPKADTRPPELKAAQGGSVGTNLASLDWSNGTLGSFCQLCNAWRGELGLEPRFQDYIRHLLQIFAEVKRVLKPDGTVFVNLGDSFVGGKGQSGGASPERQAERNRNGESLNKAHQQLTSFGTTRPGDGKQSVRPKSLMNIPHRFFIGMTDELQMIQRNNINWWKRACMPSSATDRWTVDFESIGFFTKNARYKFNQAFEPNSRATIERSKYHWAKSDTKAAGYEEKNGLNRDEMYPINPEGRNARTTWDIGFEPSGDEHYASYPTKLVERMMLAGTDENDIVYDPFGGTATTALTAHRLGRQWICSELQPNYVDIANRRLEPHLAQAGLF